MNHTIEISPSGQRFVATEQESVLDAALRQGITLPYGCRNGACGSCKSRLLKGEIWYPQGVPGVLTPQEIAKGFVLLCQARASTDLAIEIQEINTVKDLKVCTLPCRVVNKVQLAHDVIALYLKLPEHQRLQFLAGQYVDILLRDGRRRAFSLANAPRDDALLELHIRHVPHGEFSRYVFEEMQEKTLLRIRGPLGNFFLRTASDRPALFLAGGTGFAPVKSILEQAFFEATPRLLYLYWGVRARRDLYLHDLVKSWTERYPNFHYVPVLSEPLAEDRWSGRTGFVHAAVLEDFPDLTAYDVYVSGPPVMVYAARDAFLERGLDPAHLYSDAFEYAYETGHDK